MNRDLLYEWLDDFRYSGGVFPERPLVTLSYAQSLDAAITAEKGKPTVLSGPEAALATHIIRSRHKGILVGIGTVLSDNPGLTVRLVDGADPRPVILDSDLRTAPDSKFLNTNSRPLIFCGIDRPGAAQAQLESKGATIIPVRAGLDGCLNLVEILKELAEQDITSLMVEGGAEIIMAFIESGIWDRAAITVVPRWIWGYGPTPSKKLTAELSEVEWIPLGNDVLCLGRRAS